MSMRKYAVTVDFGDDGYTRVINIFQLWLLVRRVTQHSATVRVRYYS